MINAWKKLVQRGVSDADGLQNGHNSSNIAHQMPHGIEKLDKNLQRKFAKGVQYNMRIVIKGDSRVGKTCLFNRLKGGDFIEEYTPTDDLRVTSIQWNYKATDDIVKIDVWEAVDSVGRTKTVRVPSPDLKLANHAQSQSSESTTVSENSSNLQPGQNHLDSSVIDVYKGADAVIMMMDMTKLWTFKYIQAEISRVPVELPILIVSNHRDMGHHRTVSAEQVKTYIASLDRYPHDGPILYVETSMRNGFGLRFIHKFVNIPFLRLQERTLVRQLEMNRCEMCLTKEELCIMQESDDYEKYLELATIRRRQQADMLSPVPGALASSNSAAAAAGMTVPVAVGAPTHDTSINIGPKTNGNNGSNSSGTTHNNNSIMHTLSKPPPSIIIGAKCALPTKPNNIVISAPRIQASTASLKQPVVSQKTTSTIEQTSSSSDELNDHDNDSDDDDSPTGNPLVANYQDDLDPDDMCDGIETGTAINASRPLTASLNDDTQS